MMSLSIQRETAALIGRGFSLERVTGEGLLRDLRAWSACLPDAVAAFGFEIELLDGRSVDFGVGFTPDHARALLVRASVPEGGTRSILESASWHRVREFVARWIDPHSREFTSITHVFLEFDTSAGERAFAAPSIFVGVSLDSQSSNARQIWLLALLLGPGLASTAQKTLDHCLTELPTGSLVLHLGVRSLDVDIARMHVCVPAHAAANYLEACGATEAAQAANGLLDRYGFGAPLATLQLEVGERVGEIVGLEFAPGSALDPERGKVWGQLIDVLTDDGLCSREMRDALLEWPSMCQQAPTLDKRPSAVRQDLSHVKIVIRPDRPLRAKAYLSVEPARSLFGPR